MIAKLADGDPGPIATEVAAHVVGSGTGVIGYGLGLGVGCAEWIPYMTGTILSAGRSAFPAYPDSVLAPFRRRPLRSERPRRARSRP